MMHKKFGTNTVPMGTERLLLKQPPQALDVEKQILGTILVDAASFAAAGEVLTADKFYDPKHQIIFEAITRLFEAGTPIDSITIFEELKKTNMLEKSGGIKYLADLSADISGSANIEYHSRIVLEKWILRQVILSSAKLIENAYTQANDVFDILAEAQKEIINAAQSADKQSAISLKDSSVQLLKHIEDIIAGKKDNFAVPTGFYDLDELIYGLKKSDLTILAARPAQGKSALALDIAKNATVPVLIFSLEMGHMQLSARSLAQDAETTSFKLLCGNIQQAEAAKLSRLVHNAKTHIFIDDTAGLNSLELRSKAQRFKIEKNIGLVIVDYLQLMQGDIIKGGTREQEISSISRSLKSLAKQLDIPVLALSQLNRSVESRTDKRPMLSDLRESGALEQDADNVIFIYRPETYGIMVDENGNSLDGIAEIIVSKQRNGALGTAKLKFVKERTQFQNLSRFDEPPI